MAAQSATPGAVPAEDAGVWERMPALSPTGGIGLFGMPTALSGAPWQLRAALSVYGFQQSNFLVQGDQNSHLSGSLQLDATLGEHVEVFVVVGVSSNRNDRTGERADEPLLLSLGDLNLGLKLHGTVGRGFALALRPVVALSSAGGTQGPSWATTSLGADALIERLAGPLSERGAAGAARRPGLSARPQQRAAGGGLVRAQRGRRGVRELAAGDRGGVWDPLPAHAAGPGGVCGVGAGPEGGAGAGRGVPPGGRDRRGDDVIRAALQGRTSDDLLNARVQQWLTLGARLATAANLTLDVGAELALSHFGYSMGPHLPVAAGYGVLTWTTDLAPARQRPARPETLAEPETAAQATRPEPRAESPSMTGLAAGEGRLRGVVRDSRTGAPVAGAMIRVVGHGSPVIAGERGEYKTMPVPAGVVRLEIAAPGYEAVRSDVGVASGQTLEVDTGLVAKPAQQATLRIDVVDDKGQPIAAQVSLRREHGRVDSAQRSAAPSVDSAQRSAAPSVDSAQRSAAPSVDSPQLIDAPPDIAGGFLAHAAAGTWVVHVDSDGYLSREQNVTLQDGGAQQGVTIALHRRSAVPAVKLGPDYLGINGSITFQSGTAELRASSLVLLNEIADLLLKHPRGAAGPHRGAHRQHRPAGAEPADQRGSGGVGAELPAAAGGGGGSAGGSRLRRDAAAGAEPEPDVPRQEPPGGLQDRRAGPQLLEHRLGQLDAQPVDGLAVRRRRQAAARVGLLQGRLLLVGPLHQPVVAPGAARGSPAAPRHRGGAPGAGPVSRSSRHMRISRTRCIPCLLS